MNARHSGLLVGFFLALMTASVFLKVLSHDFVVYDDDLYVTENRQVQEGLNREGIQWAFTTFHAGNWHPLTWLSHMLDCQSFGLNAESHHFTNLVLHVLNTLLLFGILKWMTGAFWPSAFVAALFAIHPLHVESVAWVAERKDLLSTSFWLLTMWAYVSYVKSPGIGRYFLALLLFALGLMAKPMLVTLPFVLLLMDYWPLDRLNILPERGLAVSVNPKTTVHVPTRMRALRLIREKIPFLFLAAASSVITFMAQQSGDAVFSLERLPVQKRIANALISYVAYVRKMFWPSDLAVFYTYRQEAFPLWEVFGAGLLIGLVSLAVVRAGKRFPYLPVGWFWYVGTLVPVIGLVQVGAQSMADRYTYVPLIGLFVMISWGISDLSKRIPYRKLFLAVSAGILLLALSLCSRQQVSHWQNGMKLFTAALRVSPGSEVVHNNLGFAFAQQGYYDAAISHYSDALRINPQHEKARFNLGFALGKTGRVDEAVVQFSRLLQIKPDYAEAHFNLGAALSQKGSFEKAMGHYSEALRFKPNYPEAHNELGIALAMQGKMDEARAHFAEALELRPDFKEARDNLRRASSLVRPGDGA